MSDSDNEYEEERHRRRHSNERDRENGRDTYNTHRYHQDPHDAKDTRHMQHEIGEGEFRRRDDGEYKKMHHPSKHQDNISHVADDKSQLSSNNDSKGVLHTRLEYSDEKLSSSQKKSVNKRDGVFNFRRILRTSFKELRNFVNTPCDPKVVVRCYIERNRSGSNYMCPLYVLCADLEDGTGRELISCRKVLTSRSAHYVFSLKSSDLYLKREQRSRMYLGKLRSISNTEYVMFDNGETDILRRVESNDSAETQGDVGEMSTVPSIQTVSSGGEDTHHAAHLAVIQYNTRIRPVELGERGMEVCIPVVSPVAHSPENGYSTAPVIDKSVDLVESFRKIREKGKQNDLYASKCFVMHEKRSRYDPLSSCLVDFQGRATVASVKNFQLIHSLPTNVSKAHAPEVRHEDDIIFQMGKITDECFNMDFKHPLSMLQAFAIAVSRLVFFFS